MRSELARVQIEAQKQSFKRNGYDQYEFLALGTACGICKELDGKVFDVKKMMPGKNAPPMHPNCRCSIAAHFMNDDDFDKWLDEQVKLDKSGENGIIKAKNTTYEGIPRKWEKIGDADDTLRSVNPLYNPMDNRYSENCYNCVAAYEMRKRGYDVVARPVTKNHYLKRHPEAAWNEPIIKSTKGNGLNNIKEAFQEWPDGARAEVSILWKSSLNGHVFVAEKDNGRVRFLDVQNGTRIRENLFNSVETEKTRFWRIDNLEPSDRGIAACERGGIR